MHHPLLHHALMHHIIETSIILGGVMKPRHYFPLGKAYGEAFCNRAEEIQKLVGNIENTKHTFLVAPRRYGKSSLCERSFKSISFAWIKLDFHLAMSDRDIERIIINGVIELIGKSIGTIEKLSAILKKYTKHLQPKFNIGTKNFSLELAVTDQSSPAENIAESLLLLDKLLQEKNKQAAILFDEFQEIGQMSQSKGIEGAIRHAAQEMKRLAFIFSGSNPHLLKNMFEDERRPLYKLCRKLLLKRIGEEHYKKHLNKASKMMWKKDLPEEVFKQIMYVTERHPYYVNYLCDTLWSENNVLPDVKKVDQSWGQVIEEERSDLLKDFLSLTENQRKILIFLASDNSGNVYSNEEAKKMDIPVSSISRAIASLIERDFIEKTVEGYRLVAPVYKALLKTNN